MKQGGPGSERQTAWHIGVLFRITIHNVRTEGATVWAAAPNPDNRYRSDCDGSDLRKICGAGGDVCCVISPGPTWHNYTAGQMSICVSWPGGGRRGEGGHLYG